MAGSAEAFQIQVAALGRTRTLSVSTETSISELVRGICIKTGLPPCFGLYHGGRPLLHGEAKIGKVGIGRDSVVEIKLRGRGGGIFRSGPKPKKKQGKKPIEQDGAMKPIEQDGMPPTPQEQVTEVCATSLPAKRHLELCHSNSHHCRAHRLSSRSPRLA